jgi:hypothetical protein
MLAKLLFFVSGINSTTYPHIFHEDRLQNDSEETIETIPTIGFNVEVLQYKNIKFQVEN